MTGVFLASTSRIFFTRTTWRFCVAASIWRLCRFHSRSLTEAESEGQGAPSQWNFSQNPAGMIRRNAGFWGVFPRIREIGSGVGR